MIVVVTGIRDLAEESYADVELAIAELVDVDEIRFGGALGTDTVALEAACAILDTYRKVYVPYTVADQPKAAQATIHRCASRVVELRLAKNAGAYLQRNQYMLEGSMQVSGCVAHLVLAFTDGRTEGGTHYTIKAAERMGIPVRIIPVASCKPAARSAARVTKNPQIDLPSAPAPIHAVLPYKLSNRRDRASDAIRAMKAYDAKGGDIRWLGKMLARYIQDHPELRADWIIPVPRRDPMKPSDLLPLANAIAAETGQGVASAYLVRTEAPSQGKTKYRGREKYPAAEHERTLRVASRSLGKVLLLDNVLTGGDTMLGAQAAILRDTGVAPVGLSALYVASKAKVMP